MESLGYIYFIEAIGTNRIKIGWSTNPNERLDHIASSCPFPVKLIKLIYGDYKTEQLWHQKFKHLRIYREWFKSTSALRMAIDKSPSVYVIEEDGRAAYQQARLDFIGPWKEHNPC
jgi:hypothetical protein